MLAQGHKEVTPVRMILKVSSSFNIILKYNYVYHSSNVYNCFSIDKFNSSFIIKDILLIIFAMMIRDQSML